MSEWSNNTDRKQEAGTSNQSMSGIWSASLALPVWSARLALLVWSARLALLVWSARLALPRDWECEACLAERLPERLRSLNRGF